MRKIPGNNRARRLSKNDHNGRHIHLSRILHTAGTPINIGVLHPPPGYRLTVVYARSTRRHCFGGSPTPPGPRSCHLAPHSLRSAALRVTTASCFGSATGSATGLSRCAGYCLPLMPVRFSGSGFLMLGCGRCAATVVSLTPQPVIVFGLGDGGRR